MSHPQPMLKVVWSPDVLKTLLDSVGPLVEDCRLTFKQDGLFISVVDASHVCFISVEIPSEQFSTYEVEGNVIIPLEIAKLNAMLKLAKKNPVTMVWGDDETDKGLVRFEVGGIVREATLLHADTVKSIDAPDINPPVKFQITSDAFNLGISAISDVSDLMKIGWIEGNPLMASASKGDKVNYTITEDVEVVDGSDEDMHTLFSCEYLKRVTKGLGQHATVFIGNDYPLRVESKNNGCSMTWMLAPRIEHN